MQLKEIKPLHCQSVLNQMSNKYSNFVIEQTRLVMRMMFDSAVENELLAKNPVTKSVKYKRQESQSNACIDNQGAEIIS